MEEGCEIVFKDKYSECVRANGEVDTRESDGSLAYHLHKCVRLAASLNVYRLYRLTARKVYKALQFMFL